MRLATSPTWRLVLVVAAAIAPPGRLAIADDAIHYGGIEIGAKGIKVVVVPVTKEGVLDPVYKRTNDVTLSALVDGRYQPAAITEAGAAVKDFYKELNRGRYKIPPERIFVVASSGLVGKKRPDNFDDLRKAVRAATAGELELREVDQKQETEFLIAGAISKDDVDISVSVDIGSGNCKLGYLEPNAGLNPGRTVTVAEDIEGTTTFAKSIEKAVGTEGGGGFDAFQRCAAKLRPATFARLKDELARKPGLINRSRVVLIGGSPWAISVLTDPEGYVKAKVTYDFDVARLRAFHKALRETGKIPTPDMTKLSKEAKVEVVSVLDKFSRDQLLAGSELLLGFAELLEWQDPQKRVVFLKAGVISWIVAYIEKNRDKVP